MTEQATYILASLARGELHGYGIARDVEELSDGRVRLTAGTLYGALNRLSADGLVEPAGERAGPGPTPPLLPADRAGDAELSAEVERLRSAAAALGAGSRPPDSGAGMRRRLLELCLLAYPRAVRQHRQRAAPRPGARPRRLPRDRARGVRAASWRGGRAGPTRAGTRRAAAGGRCGDGRRSHLPDLVGDGSERPRRGGPVHLRRGSASTPRPRSTPGCATAGPARRTGGPATVSWRCVLD